MYFSSASRYALRTKLILKTALENSLQKQQLRHSRAVLHFALRVRPNEEQTGCTFAWSSAGVDITSGIFIMPAGDVDIYGAFSAGDNTMIFMIDGKEYGRIGAVSGQTVDLGMMPTKYGHTFSGWTCDEIDVSEGVFKMPEGDIVLRGSFVPNAHDIFFIDIASDVIINTSHLDYSARFSLVDRIYTAPGKVSDGWILLAGHALLDGDEYIRCAN